MIGKHFAKWSYFSFCSTLPELRLCQRWRSFGRQERAMPRVGRQKILGRVGRKYKKANFAKMQNIPP